MVYIGPGTPKILSRPFPNISSLQWDKTKWSYQPLYPPLPRPPRPFGPPPPPLFLPSVRLGRLPPPVISSSVGARDQSLSSSLWSDSVSEALDASELVPGGWQWTQIELHVESKVYFLEQSLINALAVFSHLRWKMPLLLFALCRLFLPLLCRASLLRLLLLLSPSLVPCRYQTRRFCLWGSVAPSRLPRLPLLSASAARQSEGAPDAADPPPVMWRIQVSQTLNLSTRNTVTYAEVKDVAKLRTWVKRMASTIHSLIACTDFPRFSGPTWPMWMLIGHDGHVNGASEELVVLTFTTFKNIISTEL